MKRNIVLQLQYDGTRYNGWQVQGNTENTIQGKIESILSKLFGVETELHGSGRTDAGVHALGQIANFKADTDLSLKEIKDYINKYLPMDIAVTDIYEADMRFHSRLSAKKKTYLYRIQTEKSNVFLRRYTALYEDSLDLEKMRKASAYLIGKHDFASFCDNKRMKKSTVREIYSVDINENSGIISIEITGNGFLYHMVRIIIGTLTEAAEGKINPQDIGRIIEAKDRKEAGILAPAQGLMLKKVYFE